MNPNFTFSLEGSQDYSNFQGYENSQFLSNPYQNPVTENIQTSQNTGKQPRADKWDAAEDVALMSAWCIVSGDKEKGKNQKRTSLWAAVKKLYDASQVEEPEKLGRRNVAQMKGRWKRLNENANKWVAAYQEAYMQKRSGMSMKDVENAAHKIYEANGSKFTDIIVFNEVMCKIPKWELKLNRDTTRSRTECEMDNEESDSSTKRSRTTEDGGYVVHSSSETPDGGGSSLQRPTGRDMAKKKGKGKASNEIVEELRALRLSRDGEVEVMKKRLDLEQQKEQQWEEKEKKKEARELKKMQSAHLNTLLSKDHLSPEDENMKRYQRITCRPKMKI